MENMAGLCLSFLLALSTCSLVFAATDTSKNENSRQFIEQLFQMVNQEQAQDEVPYIEFKQWHRNKGVYTQEFKFNFIGSPIMAEARRLLAVFNNNMFANALITSTLLEAFKYGDAPKLSDDQMALSVNFFEDYHDKNAEYNTSLMSFCAQVYDKTVNYWHAAEENQVSLFEIFNEIPIQFIEPLLNDLEPDNLLKFLATTLGEKILFHLTILFPPDFDDTFVYMGIGSLLSEMRDELKTGWELWSADNTNITTVFDALKKYPYRPFSSDPNLNTIDPRSYFFIRKFLDQARSEGYDIALIPTWIQSIEEQRTMFFKGASMPYLVNIVDVTSEANEIYGMTSLILSGLVSPDVLMDPEIEQIYLNTSSLIAFEIKNNLTDRPDLAMAFYPSEMEFYWLVTRTLTVLETAKRKGPLPVPVMDKVYDMFKTVAENEMTKQILSKARAEQTEKVYFDDFLGDSDYNEMNESIVRGDDRIFTTAMAANALIYTWSVYDEKTKTSHWKDDLPPQVLTTITGCINWLTEHTTDGKYKPWNVIFSSCTKGSSSIPFWFPGNRLEYLNGTAIEDWTNIPKGSFLYGVQGYIPTDRYDAMLNETHFGKPTPITFNGFNDPSSPFMFWTSVPYTYSSVLLAVSRFSNIVG